MSYESLDDALFRELHEWSAELADDRYNPESMLIAAEDDAEDEVIEVIEVIEVTKKPTNKGVTLMTTLTNTNTTFSLDNWLNTLNVVSGTEVSAKKITNKPEWLDCKGPLDPSNSFAITAGVVKAARKITDGLTIAKARLEDVNERIQVQDARAFTEDNGDRRNAPGLNPDGFEYPEALRELHQDAEKLEAIINNGTHMLMQVLGWIDEHADDLELKVEVGHTIEKDIIGNEFRVPRLQKLDRSTLLIGIAKQKEFILRNRK